MEHNKKWYLDTLREQQDPLLTLFELRIPEAEKDTPETKQKINSLLAQAGSELRLV